MSLWAGLRLGGGLGALALLLGLAIASHRHPQPEAKQAAIARVRRWLKRGD